MTARVNADVAYRFIRERILAGKYPPGSPLTTKLLAGDVGVSRTPIRDALRLLENDGLVVIRPRLGARVKQLQVRELADLCEMRMALESYAAGLAAQYRAESELDEVRAALAAMEGLVDRISRRPDDFTPIQIFQQEDLRFHLAVLTAARNPLIKKECTHVHLLDQVLSGRLVLDSAPDLFNWKDRLDQVSRTDREHHQILRAIEKGDVRAARQAMEAHLLPKVQRCREAIKAESRHRKAVAGNLALIEGEGGGVRVEARPSG